MKRAINHHDILAVLQLYADGVDFNSPIADSVRLFLFIVFLKRLLYISRVSFFGFKCTLFLDRRFSKRFFYDPLMSVSCTLFVRHLFWFLTIFSKTDVFIVMFLQRLTSIFYMKFLCTHLFNVVTASFQRNNSAVKFLRLDIFYNILLCLFITSLKAENFNLDTCFLNVMLHRK